jgi:hypothetical protein
MRKQKTAYEFTMPSMNSDLYGLRRLVIDEIYRIKKTYSRLPRIEVRIVNPPDENSACGYAWLNQNIIHISSQWVNNKNLPEIVAHEVVHAVTGFRHDDNCLLMSKYVTNNLDYQTIDKCLEKYLSEYK